MPEKTGAIGKRELEGRSPDSAPNQESDAMPWDFLSESFSPETQDWIRLKRSFTRWPHNH
jgi:hypothetical protein